MYGDIRVYLGVYMVCVPRRIYFLKPIDSSEVKKASLID